MIEVTANKHQTHRGYGTTLSAPMRLLHVVAGNLYGGVERMLATIAKNQTQCFGSQHEFAMCFPGQLEEELFRRGCAIHRLGGVKISRPWSVLSARRRLHATISTERFDVVLFHGCWPLSALGWQTPRVGCRSILWVHDAISGRHWLERLARHRQVDLFVANSLWVLESATRWRPDVPGAVICCPVDLPASPMPYTGRVRRELGCSNETVVIVQVSRLEKWKGHRCLIDAARQLRTQFPELPRWEVWFVGGAQRPHEVDYLLSLQRQANEAQLTDVVRWLGQRSDVSEILADADIFSQPNLSPEPLGIVFLEAMAQGLPIVSTDFGGAREIVPPDAGQLVAPDDAMGVAAALARLIGSPLLRQSIRSAGPSHARRLADPTARLRDLEQLLAATSSDERV